MYDFELKWVGIVVGVILLVGHILAFVKREATMELLRGFARSVLWGRVLSFLAAGWAFWMVITMDLGEFAHLRKLLIFGVPLGWILAIKFVDEFLSVRALGILLLLAACPVLDAAFLRPETSRLLLVVLAYAWIIKGLFWVGMPFLFRDQVNWLLRDGDMKFRAACVAGVVYSGLILVCALAFY